MYEVEIKYPLEDAGSMAARLGGLGARFAAELEQCDRYYSHPCRDFASSDEALRIRRTGDTAAITWKGPRLGGETKTRREIELPLAPDGEPCAVTVSRWHDLLAALGFSLVREVSKRRHPALLAWHGEDVAIAIDRLPGVGAFLELEVMAPAGEVPGAEARLRLLAAELGCHTPERRSYLEMLIEAAGTP